MRNLRPVQGFRRGTVLPVVAQSKVRSRLAVGIAAVALAGVGGCHLVEQTARLPVRTVEAVLPVGQPKAIDPAATQAEVLRYADDFASRNTGGIEEMARQVNTPESRMQSLRWKLMLNSAAVNLATGANPTANLIDFLGLASLTRLFVEQRAADPVQGEAFAPWLASCRALETNAWKLAEATLTPEQQVELQVSIARWLDENSDAGGAFFRRPEELVVGLHQTAQTKDRPGSVFTLFGLDPTAGLDPAVREVTRTRLFAERALYAMERMPFLIRWQTELLAEQVLRQEYVTNAAASAERLSEAAVTVSQVAVQLPDRVTAERKAILEALEAQEGKLRDLSAEVGRTLVAGEAMSSSLNATIQTFDALMKRFGVGEAPPSASAADAPPFNILDYAHTADRIAAMAAELNLLLTNANGTVTDPAVDRRVAELAAFSAQARADAKSVLNHAFLLVAGLILLGFACVVAARRLRPRGASLLVLALCLFASAGCRSVGPGTVRRDRLHYSTALADSWKEQLLLNIVRSRYGEAVTFLEVSSLVSGYSLETGVSLNGQFSPENLRGDSFAGGELSGKFTDRPTISYSPMTGDKFARSLIAPVPLDALLFVVQGGAPADFLLGLTLESFEGQHNEQMHGLEFAPADPGFRRILQLLRALQDARAMEVEVQGQADRREMSLLFYPPERVRGSAVEAAAELKQLVKEAEDAEKLRIVFGTWVLDPGVIGLRTRSLMQILMLLGAGVRIPPEHVEDGSAAGVSGGEVAGGFVVHSGKNKPEASFVAVPYEGLWFWIDRTDLHSKRTLGTVGVLFNFLEGAGSKASPVLTIPTN